MSKALVIFLYGVTLYITLSRWYGAGNSGLPEPRVVAPASWLFGILALTADFLEGLPVILAAALTFILYLERPASTGRVTTKNMGLGKQVNQYYKGTKPDVNPNTNPKAAGPPTPTK